jgi:gas vesicle protein
MSENHGGVGAGGVILAFLAGAAIGGVAALLLAPRSGEQTRKRLMDFSDDAKEKLTRVPGALRDAEKAAVGSFSDTMKKG